MKLLFVVSSLDLTQPFSATPAWWQLMKGLYEVGVEVIATPYQGPAIESLWWRAVENPAKWQGDAFKTVRDTVRKLRPETPAQQVQMTDTTAADDYQQESASDKLIRQMAQTLIAPLWLRHLDNLLTKEPDIDAVVFVTIPLNQLNGVPEEIIRKHNKPVFYYDGDVPASLPNMKGFATGFRIYNGSKPQEYTAFISNSTGGEDLLRQLGAKATHTLWYGADPDVFAPTDVAEQDLDVMFYGHGREYRGEWVDAMIRDASNALPDARFAVRGTRLGDLGRAQSLPYLSFSKLREYACRSKINLCITRGAHASVYGSSSSRPFELSAMQCCIVANPYNGLDQWFEPEKEIVIVNSGEEALDRYRFLLSHDEARLRMALAARERVLKEHTFRHRARDLVKIVQMYL
ncbi:MAG: glycosyltransferase [Anaerolineae bacterium]|nr:glycosyltransferase [Anaerolineae bacterium]